MRAWVFGVALGLLCGGCEDQEGPSTSAPEAFVSPEAPGPYAVGVMTIETTDGEPGGRTLPVEVWYPAQRGGGEPERYGFMLGQLKLAELPSPQGAVRDAQPDRAGAPYPAVVFSHGFGGVRVQSVYLCEYLASHGFVVAAPDHVGNTLQAQVNKAAALPTVEVARLRPIDVSRTLDAILERSAASQGALSSMIDPDRVGVAGHSFGGFTALRIAGASIDLDAASAYCDQHQGDLLCAGWTTSARLPPPSARDGRFKAALPQAPGGTMVFQPPGGKDGFADVAIPLMIQAGTTDQTTPFPLEAQQPFDAIRGGVSLLSIERAGHFTFSDVCAMNLGMSEFDDGCSASNIGYAQAQALINTYATAFFQARLAGRKGYDAHLRADAALVPGVASLQAK